MLSPACVGVALGVLVFVVGLIVWTLDAIEDWRNR